MTSLFVLGAERSGVSILAHALAREEALPIYDDIAVASDRISAGEHLVVFAPDATPDCPHLSRMSEILAKYAGSRALVVWRQGVDFINSRLRARPGQHFIDHCRLWTRSLKTAHQIQSQFPGRVELIEFRMLVDRSSPAARTRLLVPDLRLTSETLAKSLNASTYGRTSLIPQRPVVDAACAAWSMGEVEAFASICGPTMQSLGEEVDLAAAARRRSLDLGRMLYERAYQVGDVSMMQSSTSNALWTIVIAVANEAATPPQLRLSAVATGGRRHLRLRLRARAAQACRLRWEILEALTRRPLLVASCLEHNEGDARLEFDLPANDGMIEMALVCSGLEQKSTIELDLIEAKLSYA